jgi:hypothetical protein
LCVVSAADRFRAAALRQDHDAAAGELAADVALYNPASVEPVVGRAAVAAALRELGGAWDSFEHLEVFTPLADDGTRRARVQAIHFRARIGDHVLTGFDLLELDDHDRIATFTVFARPVTSLQALGAAIAARRAQR